MRGNSLLGPLPERLGMLGDLQVLRVPAAAARSGHTSVLKYLVHERRCPVDERACAGAAANGDLEALRWLRDKVARSTWHIDLDLIADPDDPRDLYGMIQREKLRMQRAG